jgi:hypothetical protein
LVDQVEEDNNYIILLECYQPFILDNNEKIRNESLDNFMS